MLTSPFGFWPTPITSEFVVAAAVRLSEVHVDVYWSEGHPLTVGERSSYDGGPTASPRTCCPRVETHARVCTSTAERRGGVREGVVWFTDWTDQRLYRLVPGGEVEPVTPEPVTTRAHRRALDAELSFYAQVLGFDLPTSEGIEPVRIENL